MSVVSSVIDFCFDTMTTCFAFLSSVEIFDGVSVFEFCLAFIIVTAVIVGLLSVVRVMAGNSARAYSRSKRK